MDSKGKLNTPEDVINFFNSIPKSDWKAISSLEQHFSLDEFQHIFSNYNAIYMKYLEIIPEFRAIFDIYAERHDYFCSEEGSRTAYKIIAYGKKSPRLVEIDRRLKKAQRELIKKIGWLNSQVAKQIQKSHEYSACLSPDINSQHFKAAQELASILTPLWFIKSVILFGSVSQGEQRSDSDVDIGVGIVPKNLTTLMRHLIDYSAVDIMENYPELERSKLGALFNIMALTGERNQQKFLEGMGFFETGYLLGEEKVFRVNLDNGEYTFNKEDVVGYAAKNGWGIMQVVLYPRCFESKKESNLIATYDTLLVSDFLPIALFKACLFRGEQPEEYYYNLELSDLLSSVADKVNPSFRNLTEHKSDMIHKTIDLFEKAIIKSSKR